MWPSEKTEPGETRVGASLLAPPHPAPWGRLSGPKRLPALRTRPALRPGPVGPSWDDAKPPGNSAMRADWMTFKKAFAGHHLGGGNDVHHPLLRGIQLVQQGQQGSVHYTPEHCLVNGGFPLFWRKKPSVGRGHGSFRNPWFAPKHPIQRLGS